MAPRRPTPPSARRRRAARAGAKEPEPVQGLPGAGVPEQTPDQFTVCTRLCGGRCCRYVTVAFPFPRGEDDWDEVRWWLAHQDTLVTQDDDGWMLHVRTPCTNLRPDNACGVYPNHMLACQQHDPTDCEYTGDVPFDVILSCEADLADYLERRRLKRGKEVARAIRRAHAAPRAPAPAPPRPGSPLVTLQGLST